MFGLKSGDVKFRELDFSKMPWRESDGTDVLMS